MKKPLAETDATIDEVATEHEADPAVGAALVKAAHEETGEIDPGIEIEEDPAPSAPTKRYKLWKDIRRSRQTGDPDEKE